MSQHPTLRDVLTALDRLWPPERAEGWDAVGTVCGDPGDPGARVSRVLFAVDPVQEIAEEAVALGAELLVTHHPLYLRGTTTVAADTFKGRVVHTLIRNGVALHVAHTNADTADPGVSDALAGALGLRVVSPLVPDAGDPEGRRGLGRICAVDAPLTLGELAERAARALPCTAQGVRLAGEPDRPVRTVAVCGGSGDGLFGVVRAAGVDAYLTADLRHHPSSEAREQSPLALLDAAHFATEWPWCEQAAAQLDAIADREGWDLRTHVSATVTDAWTARFGAEGASGTPGAPAVADAPLPAPED
ncbi:Nif3-like dinuclear metal center hexameric protein [Streptomyces sp. AJS327]|uniref:Nif3-like dinuclear metal center hexameric protein n=1 Tax=Streptomyces sp. AJS327 TaxID=2545265 RepID=UPI0015DDC095|nr:Nif3-like dinuclear metal center hexameric protein [Streptomyces sp. AJS327]MBA0050043.1 Nif3-like dinuclear metal center hexameric protein [Streptomyces sp. AJS327]